MESIIILSPIYECPARRATTHYRSITAVISMARLHYGIVGLRAALTLISDDRVIRMTSHVALQDNVKQRVAQACGLAESDPQT